LDSDDQSEDGVGAHENECMPAPSLNFSSFDVFTPLSARQRAEFILGVAPLPHHLLNIAAISLEKSSSLRHTSSTSLLQK